MHLRPCSYFLSLLFALGALLQCHAVGVAIENETLSATWDEDSARLSILHKPSGRIAVESLVLEHGIERVEPEAQTVQDRHLGAGEAIVFLHEGGNRTRLELFPSLPFALIRSEVVNTSDKSVTLNRCPVATLRLGWETPVEKLRTFGTGGLLPVDENPGSYAWLATVDPKTREGVVLGWLTHERGSGVLFSRKSRGKVEIDTRVDYGRLSIAPEGVHQHETLAVGFFEDARLGLETWADAAARLNDVRLPPQPTGYCTWYSRPHGGASDEVHLVELARFAAEKLAPWGFSVVQIDDKWQLGNSTNGPNRNFSSHDPEGPYPNGMKAVASQIAALGLTPGIWFMPFAGTHYGSYYQDKQDWFVKTEDGEPYETRWGGTCLDMTHPAVREHLRQLVQRIANEWGFKYFKIDGLWTGTGTPLRYVNSGYKEDGMGDAVFQDPSKTNIEAYRDGLKLVREAAGPDVFILGCNGPQNMRSYGAAMGLVDAMRVGPDNGPQWEQLLRGPTFGSRHYFLHGRVWYNDPDPVYVRESMPLDHARLICSWVALTGQLNLSSEWLPGLPEERLDILQRTMPNHGLQARPLDLFEHDPPRIWTLADERSESRRDVIGLFNWGEESLEIEEELFELGLEGTDYVAYDYWRDQLLQPVSGRLQLEVPRQSCRILSLREKSNRPQLVSTSRHVTQGIVDVFNETWNAKRQALEGTSQIVAGVEYELRVVMPNANWRVQAVYLGGRECKASCLSLSQEGILLRIGVQSDTGGTLDWSLRFAH